MLSATLRLALVIVVLSFASRSQGQSTQPPQREDGNPLAFDVDLRILEGPPHDSRLGDLRNLNGYFPFRPMETTEQWSKRQRDIRQRILVSQGLWPMPTKAPLRPVIHGRVERDDYVVDRVYFESLPGHFVTGSLYRPKHSTGKRPAILSPHGHWNDGRFYDAGEAAVRSEIQSGAEKFEIGGRYPIQARAVQLARMGCLVFVYDMTGYADSIQIEHRPSEWSHLDRKQDWGFMSAQAELRLQNMMGLQTWNSIRAIDFLEQLDEVDSSRIGVTGASGGGTQSMILAAIDSRIAAAMPCVMVSTAMQGGCTCENAPLLRIDQGNIEIAAAVAPRPLGLTAADDWTIELETKGYPDLRKLYEMLGHPDRLTAVFHTQFKHNYNAVNRMAMYQFFNRHFQLGLTEPIVERDFLPLTRDEATVWTDEHPKPTGDQIGDEHEVNLLRMATADDRRKMTQIVPQSAEQLDAYLEVVGEGWKTILARSLDEVSEVRFAESKSWKFDGEGNHRPLTIRAGILEHVSHVEVLPVIEMEPDGESKGVVVWLSERGKASMFKDRRLNDSIRHWVDRGWSVLGADLFQQGEFLSGQDDDPVASQRMWYQGDGSAGWHRFAGYTYGYNHCLFVRRVHDVLTLLKHAQSKASTIHLVGLDAPASLWAAAAASQSGDVIKQLVISPGDFRFEQITRQDDPMFVPGAVKYLDADGLVSLVAPRSLTIVGPSEWPTTRHVYEAFAASDQLKFSDTADSVANQW
jgi:dienelactone hydrolase